MEQEHRDIITQNMEHLVGRTSNIGLEMLLEYLVRDGVFTESMVQKYRDPSETAIMKKTSFFLDIQTRGPLAFDKFVQALTEAGANDLVRLLQPNMHNTHRLPQAPVQRRGAQPSDLPAYMTEGDQNLVTNLQNLAMEYPNAMINLSTEPLIVQVRPSVERLDLGRTSKIPHYHVGSNPKGLAMIINIRKYQQDIHPVREGAEIDGQNMKSLFQQLGYETEMHDNLISADFRESVRRFAARREHAQLHSCMVAIMSHGNMVDSNTDLSTVIYAADGIPIKYNEIIEKFNSENCPGLINKPKVFFFQACRGNERNRRVSLVNNVRRTETDGFGNFPMRNLSDMLIAHATPRGYEAVRDRFTGSWFIQTVVKVFMEHAWETDVAEMLDMVDHQMRFLVSEENGLQTTCVEKIGFSKFFISPGLYDGTVPPEP